MNWVSHCLGGERKMRAKGPLKKMLFGLENLYGRFVYIC